MSVLWDWFVLDRAAIGDGQLWRLFTGHLVHYTGEHLAYNVLAAGLAMVLTPPRLRKTILPLLLVSAPVISLSLLLMAPDMNRYAGFSGLICAWLTWVAINGLRADATTPTTRIIYWLLLLGLPTKILVETVSASTILPYSTQAFAPMHLAHAAGFVVALLAYQAPRFTPPRKTRKDPRDNLATSSSLG